MNKTTRYILLVTTLAASLGAHAFDVDLRGEYRTGSEEYRSRAKVANQWDNNFGASLEAGVFNGKGSLDEFRNDFNEIEAWYLYKATNTVTVIPGSDWTWNASGSTVKPFVRVNWEFAPTWRADMRLRYDHDNYSGSYWNSTTSKSTGRNSQWQYDFWLTKRIGDKTAIEYNYVWNKKDDSQFVYKTGHNTQYLHNIKTSYKATPTVIPYFEVGYLGEAADLKNDKDEWRLRVGTVLKF